MKHDLILAHLKIIVHFKLMWSYVISVRKHKAYVCVGSGTNYVLWRALKPVVDKLGGLLLK